jgi:hypothetical protein
MPRIEETGGYGKFSYRNATMLYFPTLYELQDIGRKPILGAGDIDASIKHDRRIWPHPFGVERQRFIRSPGKWPDSGVGVMDPCRLCRVG